MQTPKRKTARRLLEESEQRYRSLFERHPDAIFTLDLVPRLVSANPSAEGISGYTMPELRKIQVAELILPEHLAMTVSLFQQSAKGKVESADIAIRHKDGHSIDLHLTLVPIFVEGEVTGVYGIARDITLHRRIERERAESQLLEQEALARAVAAEHGAALLAEASAALSASLDYEETLSALAHLAVPVFADWCAIDILRDDGSVRRVVGALNPILEEHVQALQQRFSGAPIIPRRQRERLSAGEPIFVPEWTDEITRAIAPDDEGYQLLSRLGTSAYIRVPLLTRGMLIGALTFGRVGKAGRYTDSDLVLSQDLARRAALAIDNARLFSEAQTAVQVRDDFLASASHDLRTPVTTIKAMAQVLQRRAAAGKQVAAAELQEGLRTIDETAGRITSLINELLDLSRLQSGRPLELERRPTDLVELVRKAVTAHEQISAGRRIVLEHAVSGLMGSWDPLRLERVINNLLSNALKYSPEGKDVFVGISVAAGKPEATGDADTAVLSVRDLGIGIPGSDLPRIFERFYRAQNVTGRPGAGIGLAGARDIVLQHGGSIDVVSEECKGTTFAVRLPLSPPDVE